MKTGRDGNSRHTMRLIRAGAITAVPRHLAASSLHLRSISAPHKRRKITRSTRKCFYHNGGPTAQRLNLSTLKLCVSSRRATFSPGAVWSNLSVLQPHGNISPAFSSCGFLSCSAQLINYITVLFQVMISLHKEKRRREKRSNPSWPNAIFLQFFVILQ